IAIAADHAGYPLKAAVAADLRARGHEVSDLGTDDPTVPSEYPDVAERVCEAVRAGRAERGIALCGSGVGVSVAANKFPGIRAGVCHDHYSAHQAVEHDDMNVLCIGARVIVEARRNDGRLERLSERHDAADDLYDAGDDGGAARPADDQNRPSTAEDDRGGHARLRALAGRERVGGGTDEAERVRHAGREGEV